MPRVILLDSPSRRPHGAAASPRRDATPLRAKVQVGARRASAPIATKGGDWSGNATAEAMAVPVVPKSAASRAVIVAELAKHFVIQQLPRVVHGQLADAMVLQRAAAGDAIITQGDEGTRFFVLEEGAVGVEVNGATVSAFQAPASFGELALLHSAPRAATIRATAPCTLWGVDRPVFRRFVAVQAASAASEKFNLLRKVRCA
jgi:hypothetical protein